MYREWVIGKIKAVDITKKYLVFENLETTTYDRVFTNGKTE